MDIRKAQQVAEELSFGISEGHSRSMAHAIWTWKMFGEAAIADIAWVLRSGCELTQTDRDWLADFIDGKVKLPPGKPPLAHLLIGHRNLAIEAAENEVKRRSSDARAAGISPRGIAAAVAAEWFERDFYGRSLDEFTAVLSLRLRRSKAPRPSRSKKHPTR
jgi:hypothetical protein